MEASQRKRDGSSGDAQAQFDAMTARLDRNEADIEVLQRRAGQASRRARVDERQYDDESRRVDRLEGRTDVNHRMILELQADGLVAKEHAANLEAALETSRTIGAAVGIVMAFDGVSEAEAFEVLRRAAEQRDVSVRLVAEEVVAARDVSVLGRG